MVELKPFRWSYIASPNRNEKNNMILAITFHNFQIEATQPKIFNHFKIKALYVHFINNKQTFMLFIKFRFSQMNPISWNNCFFILLQTYSWNNRIEYWYDLWNMKLNIWILSDRASQFNTHNNFDKSFWVLYQKNTSSVQLSAYSHTRNHWILHFNRRKMVTWWYFEKWNKIQDIFDNCFLPNLLVYEARFFQILVQIIITRTFLLMCIFFSWW